MEPQDSAAPSGCGHTCRREPRPTCLSIRPARAPGLDIVMRTSFGLVLIHQILQISVKYFIISA